MGIGQATSGIQVRAEHIGGIEMATVDLEPGVNILVGENATNRTSFLKALALGLGSEREYLNAAAAEGRVEVSIGEETYVRELERNGDTVVLGGEPYLDDAAAADPFAFLLEDNRARRAIERHGDLRELITAPIDDTEIEAEMTRLNARKDQLDEEIGRLADRTEELPDLKARRQELEATLETVKSDLEEERSALESARESLSGTAADGVEDDDLAELQSVRAEIEEVCYQLETEREVLSALEEDCEEIEGDLEALEDAEPVGDRSIDEKIAEHRDRIQDLESTITEVQRVIQFNEKVAAGSAEFRAAFEEGQGEGGADLTKRLVGDRTVCWTCGSEVPTDGIEETIGQLRDYLREKRAERESVEAELESLREAKQEREERRDRRTKLETDLEATKNEIEEKRVRIESLKAEKASLAERVTELRGRIEASGADAEADLAAHQERVIELERQGSVVRDDLDDVVSSIEEIEAAQDRLEEYRTERADVNDRLQELRTRIERIEREAVEEFNERMETVLSILKYRNIARVWIERVEGGAKQGRPSERQTEFELHLVRETADGTVYEDTTDHLSESEREVVGLVFALAGHLVHDVHESVPVMLLDSLEAIDSERIASLVEYFAEFTPYLVVALLPEDAEALPEECNRVPASILSESMIE